MNQYRVVAMVVGTALAASSAPAVAGGDFTGTFQTQSGAVNGKGSGKLQMTIAQKGSSLVWSTSTGYTYICALKRTSCEGTWSGKTGAGWFAVEFSGNGDTFTGSWGYDSNRAESGTFSGRR